MRYISVSGENSPSRSDNGVDEDRIAVFGHSYGAYNAAMQLVTAPDLLAAGVCLERLAGLHGVLGGGQGVVAAQALRCVL